MLPTSNILPCTYGDLSTIMKDIGMEYQDFDACPNDHIKYYGPYGFKMEYLQCHASRYQTHQVKKKRCLNHDGIEAKMVLFKFI